MSGIRGKLWRVDHLLRDLADRWHEREFDRRRNVRTAGRPSHSRSAKRQGAIAEATHYQAVPEGRLAELVDALPIEPSGMTFVDLGCGRGRALLVAEELGFSHVVGVEFDPVMADEAKRNVDSVAPTTNVTFEVRCQDAAEFELPQGPTLIFLYNPFGPGIMSRLVAGLEASLAADPRPVWVLYMNPLHAEAWVGSDAFAEWPLPADLAAPPALRLLRGIPRHRHGYDLATRAFATEPPA